MWMNSGFAEPGFERRRRSGVVQVMTVHKAKGLTFDVTLVRIWRSQRARDRSVARASR